MDAALVSAAGISAVLLADYSCVTLCGVSFFGALFVPSPPALWRALRLGLALLGAPLEVAHTLRHVPVHNFSAYLSALSLAITIGDSFESATVYPFLVFFACLLSDFALAARQVPKQSI